MLPARPEDAYGLLLTAIRDDDPVAVFAPAGALAARSDVDYSALAPLPLGRGRVARSGSDVTVAALGHLVHDAVAVAESLDGEASVEVFDPRSLYPFDWAGLEASVEKTRRLVVFDDTNRFCGLAAEIVAVVTERIRLAAPPRRITRPDGAVLPFAAALDRALQPQPEQLRTAVQEVMKAGR